MPHKFINPKTIRKDMRKLGILTIFAGLGLVGLSLPDTEAGAYSLWSASALILIGFVIWFAGVYKPHNPSTPPDTTPTKKDSE